MTAQAAPRVGAARRRLQLQVMGIQSWRLRRTPMAASPPAMATGPELAACVILLPNGCDLRIRDLLARALQSAGPALARIGCLALTPTATGLPPAASYLLLTSELAELVQRQQPAARCDILERPELLLTAAGKRWLWQQLHALRRRISGTGS